MGLDKLSAKQLAKIDKICLEYEAALRRGVEQSVETFVASVEGELAQILREELEGIQAEVQQAQNPDSIVTPFQSSNVGSAEAANHSENSVTQSTLAGVSPFVPINRDQIGPYEVLGEIGRGGMGVVFQATDTRLDRKVAIKMLAIEGSKSQSLIDRFEREAKAVAALSHPNIVELFDVGVSDGIPFAVMEYLLGETLAQRLKHHRFTPSEVRSVGAQIADALSCRSRSWRHSPRSETTKM